jgi:CheY-like chemotaxis protein
MVEAATLACRWLGLRPTHPSQRYGFCFRRFFMVNLPHGREIQGSLGVRSLFLEAILRLVWLNGLSVEPYAQITHSADTAQFNAYQGPARTVLLVDDHEQSRQVLSALLLGSGFTVVQAASGNEASKILRQDTPLDLVLTDQFMDDGDGWTVLESAHERATPPPVVLISAAPAKRPAHLPDTLQTMLPVYARFAQEVSVAARFLDFPALKALATA